MSSPTPKQRPTERKTTEPVSPALPRAPTVRLRSSSSGVGVFDACRGGSWTRSKGLTAAPAIELKAPFSLQSEGTVLFAASSGLESAHESDRLRGSFFTHHLVGGLLGAADISGDGVVTAPEQCDDANTIFRTGSRRATINSNSSAVLSALVWTKVLKSGR